ncbi:Oidioi.mRNA.OKI2018_I69.PAR.g10119.t1.cds [Oikopleura dioica]|uniref:Oidioi.mRNA.OKI2018_I69.PAR.g10119.t1.cds n=1 Tax=Oikopleura dioica TaxID=34765 RepID=A0ABN7RSZ3_OIKDI|nr:Oidioi.mRNA.OKI2018_I69.PAR.g10119.t1.cds [Oikopleura dioica]
MEANQISREKKKPEPISIPDGPRVVVSSSLATPDVKNTLPTPDAMRLYNQNLEGAEHPLVPRIISSLASNSSNSSEVKREPETDHPEIPVQQIQAISSEGPMISAIDFTASTKNSINPMVPMVMSEHSTSHPGVHQLPTQPIDMDTQLEAKLERKRERNRAAATKCRQRKIQKIQTLESHVQELTRKNEELKSQRYELKEQLKQLEMKINENPQLREQFVMTHDMHIHRPISEATKGLRFGGFNDPWWSGSKWNRDDSFAIPDKQKDKFPMLDDQGGPHRPLKNRDWAKRTDPRGKNLRKANQYSVEFNGHAPKPYWVMEGVDKETGEREFFAGLPAKPIWRQPSKKQREAMINTHEYDHEEIPVEFMHYHAKISQEYNHQMKAVRAFAFEKYVEPVLVEEEAIAQCQLFVRQNSSTIEEFKAAKIEAKKYPVRHDRFLNWYSFSKDRRGANLVQKQIQLIQSKVDHLEELRGNAGMPAEYRDVSRRIAWNEFRNESMKEEFMQKLETSELKRLEREEREVERIRKYKRSLEKKHKKEFQEWTAASKDFLHENNVDDKILSALERPTTHNFPVDELGRPDLDSSKIHTAERNFRLTPTEQEYFVLRKMREEQRIKGNVDLAEQLTKQFSDEELLQMVEEFELAHEEAEAERAAEEAESTAAEKSSN